MNDSAPTAPFPGVPVGADLHRGVLTIYWAGDPATGQYPMERISAPHGGWTRDQVNAVLLDYGVAIDTLRAPRAWEALVSAMVALVAVGERASRAAHALRGLHPAPAGGHA